jgi:hypothetical protein
MKLFLSLVCVLLFVASAHAQIEWSGSIDLEGSVGGKDSQFISNEISSDFHRPHFLINQFNLFAFSKIGDEFSFSGRLQANTWGTGQLSIPNITLATVAWQPKDSPISVSLGQIITPFGLYSRRQLSTDNLFANAPLIYDYFVNISDKRGLWPAAGNTGTYGSDDVGLTTIYFGGYIMGGSVNWILIPNKLGVEVGVTNEAVASSADFSGLGNAAIVGRVGIQPAIWWQQGFSASYGSFMQRDDVNIGFNNLNRYTQLVLGTDIILSYSYFEFSSEAIYALWKVPKSVQNVFKTDASGNLIEFSVADYGGYADVKFEPPFLTGSYVAVRFEKLVFPLYDDPITLKKTRWDNDVSRVSIALGYKIAKPVLLKLTYASQSVSSRTPSPDLDSFRAILTVSF